MSERPDMIEVAVTDDWKVSINYKDLPVGEDGWGHLTFDFPQAMALIRALQEAAVVVFLKDQVVVVTEPITSMKES